MFQGLPISRPWREIARELASETNPDRILELAEELNRAMEGQQFHEKQGE